MKDCNGHWFNIPRPRPPTLPQLLLPPHLQGKVPKVAPMSMHDPQRTHAAMQSKPSLPPSPLWYPPCPPPHADLVAIKLEAAALEKQVLHYRQQATLSSKAQDKAEQKLREATDDAACFRVKWQDSQLEVALLRKDATVEIGELKKELEKKDSWLKAYRENECSWKEQVGNLKGQVGNLKERVRQFDAGVVNCRDCERMQWEVEAEEREHHEDVGALQAKLKETDDFLKTCLSMYAPDLLEGYRQRQEEAPLKLHCDGM